jgi:hypothetical protein
MDATMALSYHSSLSAPSPSVPYQNSIPTSSTSPTTTSPTNPQFPLFTHLPPELRLKIWLLTLPTPRLVPLTYTSTTSRTSLPSSRGCTSPAAIPVSLHINHESRVLALSYYTLSFGLAGSISTSFPNPNPPISSPPSLENKIYFSPQRNDILFFGLPAHHSSLSQPHQHQHQNHQEAIKSFVNACLLVSPSPTGFSCVTRLAVQKSLFTSPSPSGPVGGKTTALLLHIFWERIRRTFTSVEEVVFVECAEDALLAFSSPLERKEMGEMVEGSDWIGEGEGICWLGDELGVWCWERERFGGMVGRVVASVEGESPGWVAPRWRVVGCRRGKEGEVDVEARRRKEEGLVRRMRELFGHEGVSNAV